MKVLNLYAGIGGNRKLWPKGCEVTAVEINEEIAGVYKDFFPEDKVVIADAHQYLLDHYKEFEFIWSSPPCPTHSNLNRVINAKGIHRYPDMRLYQEVILLKEFFSGVWVVENVKPYYQPLIPAQESGRHYFWANFPISDIGKPPGKNITGCCNARMQHRKKTASEQVKELQKMYGFDVKNLKMLVNCVHPKLGLHVFNCAFKHKQERLEL